MAGTPKPILKLQNGSLVVANVPVPREITLRPRLFLNGRCFKDLKAVHLSAAVLNRISPPRPSEPTTALFQTISKVVDELRSLKHL
jgi:hypothetical protein